MVRIDIKALSINQAFQGKRFKTPKYKQYTKDVLKILPPLTVPDGQLRAFYEFGVSNMGSDVDNMVKCLQDQLQTKYNFKDSKIIEFTACKVKVKKGDEYIKFKVEDYEKEEKKEVR